MIKTTKKVYTKIKIKAVNNQIINRCIDFRGCIVLCKYLKHKCTGKRESIMISNIIRNVSFNYNGIKDVKKKELQY